MRDVIVIGAGGGGPVVAKELAAQGLDVLLLEAAACSSAGRVDDVRGRREQPADRLPPLGTVGPVETCLVPRVAAELLRLAIVRRWRHDAALLRQLSARVPRSLRGVRRCRSVGVRRQPPVPVRILRNGAVLRMGRGDDAGDDSGDGPQGADVLPRCRDPRVAGADHQDDASAVVPAAGERDPAAGRDGREDLGQEPADLSAGDRVHLLWLLLPGLHAAEWCPAQPIRQAVHGQQLRPDGIDRRRVVRRPAGRVDHGRVCHPYPCGKAARRTDRDRGDLAIRRWRAP
jgi:hypothetical protein